MTADEFSANLRKEGFDNIVLVEREPNGTLDHHSHPFEAKALILDGEIHIVVDGHETTYRPGDVFHLPHAIDHIETYGPEGVRYLVGRR
jgi:quercetin dioxygenase-like cupin family protein